MEKVFGTPQHPSEDSYLPPNVYVLKLLFLIMYKCPNIVVRASMVMHVN